LQTPLWSLAFFAYFFWQCKKVRASRGSSDKAKYSLESKRY
jgi:hypothetical protein